MPKVDMQFFMDPVRSSDVIYLKSESIPTEAAAEIRLTSVFVAEELLVGLVTCEWLELELLLAA